MRIVWVIEKASSAPGLPLVLAEGDDEVLRWTRDLESALGFTERHLAVRFVQNRVTEPVCIEQRLVDEPKGWAADNIALRKSRDVLDAFKARQAAELARAA